MISFPFITLPSVLVMVESPKFNLPSTWIRFLALTALVRISFNWSSDRTNVNSISSFDVLLDKVFINFYIFSSIMLYWIFWYANSHPFITKKKIDSSLKSITSQLLSSSRESPSVPLLSPKILPQRLTTGPFFVSYSSMSLGYLRWSILSLIFGQSDCFPNRRQYTDGLLDARSSRILHHVQLFLWDIWPV